MGWLTCLKAATIFSNWSASRFAPATGARSASSGRCSRRRGRLSSRSCRLRTAGPCRTRSCFRQLDRSARSSIRPPVALRSILRRACWVFMDFDIITAFPGMFEGPLGHSIVRRARERGLITLRVHDLRDYASDRHRKVDDVSYGGGGGMVLMPAPLFAAVEAIQEQHAARSTRTILLCPQGTRYDQEQAKRLATYDR